MTNRELGIKIYELHKGHASQNLMNTEKPYMGNIIGVAGEREFCDVYGFVFDEVYACTRPQGDGGIDVRCKSGGIDVKTSRRSDALLVKEGTVKADFYVAGHFTGNEFTHRVRFLGWVYAWEVLAVPPRVWPKTTLNHVVWVADLRPMSELVPMLH